MSTGSPLPDTTWRWVYDAVSADVHLGSDSGGTDVATGFIGANPISLFASGNSKAPTWGSMCRPGTRPVRRSSARSGKW